MTVDTPPAGQQALLDGLTATAQALPPMLTQAEAVHQHLQRSIDALAEQLAAVASRPVSQPEPPPQVDLGPLQAAVAALQAREVPDVDPLMVRLAAVEAELVRLTAALPPGLPTAATRKP